MQTSIRTDRPVETAQGDPLEEHRAWALVRLLNLVGSEPPRMTEPWRGRLGA